MSKQLQVSKTSAYYLLGNAETLSEAKAHYEQLKRRRVSTDVLERHYFRAKQRILLGEVLMEDAWR